MLLQPSGPLIPTICGLLPDQATRSMWWIMHWKPHEEDEQADEVQEVLAAFNEEEPQMEDNNEPIEEQDAIDVLLSWKQTRTQINREKLSRGLGGSQDLRKLEARVKCFKCQKVGHFSRNCPLRKSKGKGSGKGDTTSSQSSRVSFVHMVHDMDEDYVMVNAELTVEDEVTAIVEGWADRPKDYWGRRKDQK